MFPRPMGELSIDRHMVDILRRTVSETENVPPQKKKSLTNFHSKFLKREAWEDSLWHQVTRHHYGERGYGGEMTEKGRTVRVL